MKHLWIALAFGAGLVACSSGEGAGNVGGAAGSNTGGGGSGGSCPQECFAPIQCVHQCGEQPVDYGCCGCPPGMIEANQCADDAGCHPSVPDAGSVTCGSSACTANQICVFHCCGGIPDDGSACKPAPPSCVDVSEVNCSPCDGTSNCSAPAASCSGILDGQNLNCLCA